MEMTKVHWRSEGETLRLSMPLTKVDQENRIVSGWATLDNEDSQGDIVLAEANAAAFSRFRGNIREMHQPIAAGRMVDFREDTYYDPNTGAVFRGIWVDVRVSTGAQPTWEKVLDGTLSGFSIGGEILDSEYAIVDGRQVRIIKSYDLIELSLVDNPANQLANVFSVVKSKDGVVMKGMLAETKVENIFWCDTDEIAKTSTEESVSCANCSSEMENIGWIEYDNDNDKTAKMKDVIDNYRSSNTNSVEETEIAKQGEPANNEGGVDVAEETDVTPEAGSAVPAEVDVDVAGQAETEVEASVEEVAAEAEAADEEEVAAPADEAADVSEVEAEEPDFAKMFGDLRDAIESGLAKTRDEATTAIESAVEKFETRIGELVEKHQSLTDEVSAIKTKTEAVEKALAAVEDETAVKKSGDLGGSTEDGLEKSRTPSWGGRFLSTSDLN
jgi:hypothetical protein